MSWVQPWWLFAVVLTLGIRESCSVAGPTRQQFILYGNNRQGKTINNNGSSATTYKNENYEGNQRDLENISRMIRDGKLKSACVQVGLWAIFYGKDFTNIASILYASSDSNDRTCTQNKINDTHYSSYHSIRQVGNADLTLPGLSLYKGKFFAGEELYLDGTILTLPSPQEFNSYGFTGKENWTLFSLQNFMGDTICLSSRDLKELESKGDEDENGGRNKDGVVYNKVVKGPLVVGSILRGCMEERNQTIVFPNGESSVQWTTKPMKLFEEDKDYTKYIKLYSEFEPDELVTDAKELRLPSQHSFPSYAFGPGNAGSNNWTVFSGPEYNGHAKCFYTSNNEDYAAAAEQEEDKENDNEENETVANATTNPSIIGKDHIIVMGSLKEGCVSPITLPVLEQHQLPKLEVEPTDNPSNTLFFTSFIIGLIIFILMILAAIVLIIYFYFSSRRRRRRGMR